MKRQFSLLLSVLLLVTVLVSCGRTQLYESETAETTETTEIMETAETTAISFPIELKVRRRLPFPIIKKKMPIYISIGDGCAINM